MRIIYTFFPFLISLALLGCGESSSSIHESSEKSESSNSVKFCLSDKECLDRLKTERVILGFRTIKGEEPFPILVSAKAHRKLTASITGVNMNMGRIPITFSEVSTGVYLAQGMVGVCSSEQMIWKIVVFDGIQELVQKEFEVKR